MSANYSIADEDRPYVEFNRLKNRGLKPRSEKKDKNGRVVRLAHSGAKEQIWRKYLISRTGVGFQEPYTWATKDWVLDQIKPDCVVVGCGNLENLPPNYPSEWRAQLVQIFGSIQPQVNSYRQIKETEARVAALEAELKSKAANLEAELKSKTAEDSSEDKKPSGKK